MQPSFNISQHVRDLGARVGKAGTGRSAGILFDTAINSLTNVMLLLLAARTLPTDGLTQFSIYQLMVSSILGLQRATIIYPTLATQRAYGKHIIPRNWIALISLPLALLSAPLTSFVSRGSIDILWTAVATVTTMVFLAQDLSRFRLFSQGRARTAISGDFAGLIALASAVLITSSTGSKDTFSFAIDWAVSGAATYLIFFIVDRSRSDDRSAKLRHTLGLGKWSAIDNILSSGAAITPLFASAFVLHSDVAGTYRLFQAAQGPLNILSTSMVALVGLDSWKLMDITAMMRFRHRIVKIALLLTGAATVYIIVAVGAISIASGVDLHGATRPVIIVAVASVLGAATIPFASAALSLGKQRAGAFLRVFVVAGSALLVIGAIRRVWIPWDDPVGTLMLLSATTNLVGWLSVFALATRIKKWSASLAIEIRTVPRRASSDETDEE